MLIKIQGNGLSNTQSLPENKNFSSTQANCFNDNCVTLKTNSIYPSPFLSQIYFGRNLTGLTREARQIINQLRIKPINIADARNVFFKKFGINSEVTAFAPGRLEFIGHHIDNYRGKVIGLATDAGTLTLGKVNTTSRIVRIHSEKYGDHEFDLNNAIDNPQEYFKADERFKHWANNLESTIRLLDKEVRLNGMDLLLRSNLPCTGISTSASSEVSVAHAVLALHKQHMSSKNIAALCKQAENNTGMGCGILDQGTIAVTRGKGRALLINCTEEPTYQNIPFGIPGHQLVFIVSGVNHSNADTYMEFRKGYDAGAKLLLTRFPEKKGLCDITPRQFRVVEAQFRSEFNDESGANKCEHGIMDNERVKRTVKALQARNTKRMAKILTESHNSADTNLGTSCNEVNQIHSIALKNGAVGGRLCGAGWGGGAFFIVPNGKLPKFVEAMKSQYRTPANIGPEMYIFTPKGGSKVLPESVTEI